MSSLEARFSVADTCDVPPFSAIDASLSDSDTVGAASSSAMVSDTFVGFWMPVGPEAVPDTTTVLSGASVVLSTAVILTTSVLLVAPATIVSCWFELGLRL